MYITNAEYMIKPFNFFIEPNRHFNLFFGDNNTGKTFFLDSIRLSLQGINSTKCKLILNDILNEKTTSLPKIYNFEFDKFDEFILKNTNEKLDDILKLDFDIDFSDKEHRYSNAEYFVIKLLKELDKNTYDFIFIDDIDRYLSPEFSINLITYLRNHYKESQIFCTIHSPIVLPWVDRKEAFQFEKTYSIKKSDLSNIDKRLFDDKQEDEYCTINKEMRKHYSSVKCNVCKYYCSKLLYCYGATFEQIMAEYFGLMESNMPAANDIGEIETDFHKPEFISEEEFNKKLDELYSKYGCITQLEQLKTIYNLKRRMKKDNING